MTYLPAVLLSPVFPAFPVVAFEATAGATSPKEPALSARSTPHPEYPREARRLEGGNAQGPVAHPSRRSVDLPRGNPRGDAPQDEVVWRTVGVLRFRRRLRSRRL